MSLSLKLSQMKKISMDKNHTVMETPDGHQVKIMHSALSRGHRKAIEKLPFDEGHSNKMAEGGEASDDDIVSKKKQVDDYNNLHEDEPKEYSQDVQSRMRQTDVTPKQRMAEGGTAYPPCKNPACKSHGMPHPNCKCYGAMAEGGKASYLCAKNSPHQQGCQYFVDGGVAGQDIDYSKADYSNESTPPTAPYGSGVPVDAAAAPLPVDQPPASGQTPPSSDPLPIAQSPATADTPAQAAPPAPVNGPVTEQQAQQSALAAQPPQPPATEAEAYKNQLAGNEAAGAAEQAQVKARAEELSTSIQAQQQLVNRLNDVQKHTQKQLTSLDKEINSGQIDPNHYLGSRDSLPRIGAAIGVFLGGIGGGGKSNQVLDFVNQQIDRDINAQKANLGKKTTLYSLLLDKSHNEQQATNMASLMLDQMTLNKLKLAEMKTNDPLIKARTLQAQGVLQDQMAPKVRQENMFKMAQGAGGDSSIPKQVQMYRLMGMKDLADDLQSKYVPGYDQPSTSPIPQKTRDELVSVNKLDNIAKDLLDFTQKHAGNFDPRVRAAGAEKAQLLQSLYRESALGTVYKPGEQGLLDKVVGSDPTSAFNALSNTPKLKELISANQRMKGVLEKGSGLKPNNNDDSIEHNLTAQQQSFLNWARANPQNPRSTDVLKKLGISK